ncbi:MAG TPA: hypothetical protein VH867_00755 [Burkholderiales bacterium]
MDLPANPPEAPRTPSQRFDRMKWSGTPATAALSIWNVGAGFLFGICAYHLCRRGLIRI